MAKKRTSGLYQRQGIWHIDKQLFGKRLCESTGTDSLSEAEVILAKRTEELRQQKVFGVRPSYTFEEAAKKYVDEKKEKSTIQRDVRELRLLQSYLSGCSLEMIHKDHPGLKKWMEARRKAGVKHRTINYGLQVLRHLLNLAAQEWRDEESKPWLLQAPKIKLLSQHDARQPRPLNWEEQERLFSELPTQLREMALYAVNTGCRDQEICQLRWEWEMTLPECETFAFVLPGLIKQTDGSLLKFTKNGESRVVVLNQIAASVIDRQRQRDPYFVFVHRTAAGMRPYYSMNTNGWKAARQRAQLLDVRVHDLRHTFGRRLRAAGVSFEDRQDLLGHKSGRMTTHYSAAEMDHLVAAVNSIVKADGIKSMPTLRVISNVSSLNARSRKSPARKVVG